MFDTFSPIGPSDSGLLDAFALGSRSSTGSGAAGDDPQVDSNGPFNLPPQMDAAGRDPSFESRLRDVPLPAGFLHKLRREFRR